MIRTNLPLIVLAPLFLLLALSACARVSSPQGWSAGVIKDDRLYIGTIEGEVRALDLNKSGQTVLLADGSEWRYPLIGNERDRAVYGTPVIEGDSLFFGGYDGILYAVTTDMDDLWREPRIVGEGEPLVGGPAVAEGLVLIGSSDGNLYAFNSSTGAKVWTFHTEGKVWSTPAVSDGVAYFGSLDHKFYAVRLDDGTAVWPSPFEAKGAITATAVVTKGRVYFGAFDSIFYALDAKTGEELLRFDEASRWYWGGAIANDDTIFAPSLDGHLYALDIDTLGLRWSLFAGAPILSSPALVHDRVAVASDDGLVIMALQADGSDQNQCAIEEEVKAALVEDDGVVYVSATDHSIRALQVDPDGFRREEWAHFTDREVPVALDWDRSC